ncbi:MAG: YfhD family protein [Gorillibacterium sp.]|nr:YfhD family protein [Gorillibacterium sp.]
MKELKPEDQHKRKLAVTHYEDMHYNAKLADADDLEAQARAAAADERAEEGDTLG